jgi:hypothetical protein
MAKVKKKKPKGLTDKELIAKYETGKRVNFDKIVTAMAKMPKMR